MVECRIFIRYSRALTAAVFCLGGRSTTGARWSATCASRIAATTTCTATSGRQRYSTDGDRAHRPATTLRRADYLHESAGVHVDRLRACRRTGVSAELDCVANLSDSFAIPCQSVAKISAGHRSKSATWQIFRGVHAECAKIHILQGSGNPNLPVLLPNVNFQM